MEVRLQILLVAAGGALGAVTRFLVAFWFSARLGTGWPYGTLFINVTGCFVIALFLTLADRFAFPPAWRYLVPTGFVGAYTTFSTYEYETMRLIDLGSPLLAAAYPLASNAIDFGAVALGTFI